MSLIGEERKRHILDVLNSKGLVKVSLLAKDLNVTTETIRRHLEELENKNKLKRVYGGAVKVSYVYEEPPYAERSIHYIKEKKLIGKKAVDFINDGDSIFIDVGTTTLEMIKYLRSKINIKIVTNSIPVLTSLVNHIKKGNISCEIIFIGGEINVKQLTVSGSLSERFLDNFYVDKAFIGVGGISIEDGLTGYDLNECTLTKKVIKHAKQSIVLSDHSKIGVRNFAKIENLENIDIIICNENAPKEWEETLKTKDVEWTRV